MKTASERIEQYVRNYVSERYVYAVTQELINAASDRGPRTTFERDALREIFPEWYGATDK